MLNKVVIFNWDHRAERIVRELHSDVAQPGLPIVVLSSDAVDTSIYTRDPIFHGVTWLAVDLFSADALRQVEAHRADTALVLADMKHPDPDGATTLAVLALRRACQPSTASATRDDHRLHVVAESVNHRKTDLIKAAGADEVICPIDFGLGVLSQAVFTPGIAEIYNDLLRFSDDSNEVYCLRVAPSESVLSAEDMYHYELDGAAWKRLFEGKTFVEAATGLMNTTQPIDPRNPISLIGVHRPEPGSAGTFFINPVRDLSSVEIEDSDGDDTDSKGRPRTLFDRFRKGDQPLVIAWQRPKIFLSHFKESGSGS